MTFIINPYRFGLVNQFAFLHDGINKWFDVPYDASLDFDRTDTFTMSVWLNIQTLNNRSIFSKYINTGVLKGWWWKIAAGGNLEFWLVGSGTELVRLATNTNLLTTGSYFHVAVTYNGNGLASGFTFYIDGDPHSVSNGKVNVTGNTLGSQTTTRVLNVGIMARQNATDFLHSYWDEGSIWSVEMTQSEINEIYNMGQPNDLSKHSQAVNGISWWRSGDAATFSVNWTMADQFGSNDAVSANMVLGDRTTNVP